MTGKNTTLGGGGFHHVAIRTRDFDRSVAFYTQTLGFEPTVLWGQEAERNRGALLDTGDGNYLEIFERPGTPLPPADPESVILHIAFRTTDIAAALARAEAAGAEVTKPVTDIQFRNTHPGRPTPIPATIAFFKGPDGEIIELFQNELT